MYYRLPQPMVAGNTVGVYVVSDSLNPDRRCRFNSGISSLEKSGFRVRLSSNTMLDDGYSAGPAEARASALRELAGDPEVSGFLSGWGGKATIDLFAVNGFSAQELAADERPWFGFSDACVLLNAITFTTGLVTFYGPNVAGKLDETSHGQFIPETYRQGWPVFGAASEREWTPLSGGSCSGTLIGGNLSSFTFAYLAGVVPSIADSADPFIFFFEAGDEDPRVLRQLIVSLALAGFFSGVVGVVLGDLGRSRSSVSYIEQALREVCGRSTVLASCPTFGHAKLENPPIPIGLRIDIRGRREPCAPSAYFA